MVMIHVQIFDNISASGLKLFSTEHYQMGKEMQNPDIILVRSHSLHGYSFNKNLRAVGRAGVGTDNIPIEQLTQLGVPVFNSPGANANAVKELVLAAMLIGYRHLDKAHTYITRLSKNSKEILNQDIEQHKKQFVGNEIYGKTLGVIGLGHVGVKVANAALGLGMRVMAYDPHISIPNALALMPSVEKNNDMNAILAHADIITLHVPLNPETTHLVNEQNINLLKKNALLLNFSRENVVKEDVILDQLTQHKMMGYITDFPTIHLADKPNVLSFPHLGASTIEAEHNSAEMVIRNLCHYIESGTVEHSVNFPNISLPPSQVPGCYRIMIINRNVPGAIGNITQAISQMGYNIEQMVNTSRETIAVNLIDISGSTKLPQSLGSYFQTIPSFINVHTIY